MTTAAYEAASPATHRERRATLRRLTSIVIVILSRLRGRLAEIGSAGQLGPDPETEVGRWTGARV